MQTPVRIRIRSARAAGIRMAMGKGSQADGQQAQASSQQP